MSDARASRPSDSASLAGTLLGRYRLERLLGKGGMGVVYEARHQELQRLVAIKILNERYGASEEVRARFLREGKAASRVRHPNIVDVYDVGTDDERAYLVMEFLEGEDLRTLLTREKRLGVERTADLLMPIVSALVAAHEKGVVHRDLKPDNVFLAMERNRPLPKVLDFGISKVLDPEHDASLTGTGAILGSPYYMSPEQAQGSKDIDARTDQYSLGVILYECVTGRRPVEEPAIYQLMHRILNGDFAPPRQLQPEVPSAFEQLILTALAVRPADRFPSMRALGQALLPFCSERVRAIHLPEMTLDEATASTINVVLTPSDPGAKQLGTTLGDSVHSSDTSRDSASESKRRPAVLAALAVLVVAGSLGYWRWSTPDETKASGAPLVSATGSAEAPPAASLAAPQPAVTSPATFRKWVVSEPSSAQVYVAGKQVGRTPFELEGEVGSSTEVELRLDGFVAERRAIGAADAERVSISLRRAPAETTPAPARPAPKPLRPALAPR